MTGRLARLSLLAAVLAMTALPAGAMRPVAAAGEGYLFETSAAYDVRPSEGRIAVTVDITFTNTTPNTESPPEISLFPEILVAVHDAASEVMASDAEGELSVEIAVNDEGTNVAAIALRDALRFEESVDLELSYTLADGADPQLRVRPSVIVFPVWSFGLVERGQHHDPERVRDPDRW